MGSNLISTNALNPQARLRICQKQKLIKNNSGRGAAFWFLVIIAVWRKGNAPTPVQSLRNQPQVWVTDVLVSTICLLSWTHPLIVWRMFIYESRLGRHRQILPSLYQTPFLEKLQTPTESHDYLFYRRWWEDSPADEKFLKHCLQIWGFSMLRRSWNGRSRLVLFTFLRLRPLNISHLTPPINFRRDEAAKNSRNSNISLIYISICLTFSVGSVALLQLQPDRCVYQPRAPAAACWELEVSRKLRETWPSDTWQPLNRHSSETVEPDALGWRDKQVCYGFFFSDRQPKTDSLLRDGLTRFPQKPLSVHAHTRAVTHSHTRHLPTWGWHQKKQGD